MHPAEGKGFFRGLHLLKAGFLPAFDAFLEKDQMPSIDSKVRHNCSKLIILYRTLCYVILKQRFKRLSQRILSLESTTNPEGAGDA
jgi:hypothetical protein